MVNVLFPDFLAEDMHGMDNIDNCGMITITATRRLLTTPSSGTKPDPDGGS